MIFSLEGSYLGVRDMLSTSFIKSLPYELSNIITEHVISLKHFFFSLLNLPAQNPACFPSIGQLLFMPQAGTQAEYLDEEGKRERREVEMNLEGQSS